MGDRTAYKNRMKDLKREYAELLDDEVPEPQEQHGSSVPTAGGMTYSDVIGSSLFGISSEETPLREAALREELESALPSSARRTYGLTEHLEPLRNHFLAQSCIEQENALPSSDKYPVPETCDALHPGVCRCHLTPELLQINEALSAFCDNLESGTIVSLLANQDEDSEIIHVKLVACSSGDGEFVIFCPCQIVDGKLKACNVSSCLQYEMGQKALLDICCSCKGLPHALSVRVHKRPQPTTLNEALSLVPEVLPLFILHSQSLWPPHVGGAPAAPVEPEPIKPRLHDFIRCMMQTVFNFDHGDTAPPASAHHANRKRKAKPSTDDPYESGAADDMVISSLEQKLGTVLAKVRDVLLKKKVLGGSLSKAAKAKVKKSNKALLIAPKSPAVVAPKALVVAPQAPPGPALVIAPKAPPAPPLVIAPKAPPAPPADKQKQGWQWGRRKWRLAFLKQGGMGATCGYHTNVCNNTKCQKTLNQQHLSDEHKRCLLKLWFFWALLN